MSTLAIDKQTVQKVWRMLLQDWRELDDDDPPTWSKSCGMLTFFITQCEEGFFEFAAHSGDDIVIIEDHKLDAVYIDEALNEGDDLIAEFVDIGASVLKIDEVRIKQALVVSNPLRDSNSNTIMAVGEDGKLYRYNDSGWGLMPMQLKL